MARKRLTLSREVPASWARSSWRIRIVTPPAPSVGAVSATSWLSTPATRPGTVWKDWDAIRSLVSRSWRVSAVTSLIVIAGFFAGFLAILFLVVPQIEFQFFPQESAPAFTIKVTMPPGTPIERTEASVDAIQRQIPRLMESDLLAVTSRVGHQDAMSFNREYG